MGLWDICLPSSSDLINLVSNPSVEVDLSGFAASGGSISRTSSVARRGVYSIAVTPTSGTNDGVYYGNVSLNSGLPYTFSCDVKAPAGLPLEVFFATTSGTLQGSPFQWVADGGWQRVSVTWTPSTSGNYRVYLRKNNHSSTNTFYTDGWQVVQSAANCKYIDGDREECVWLGAPHLSQSKQLAGSSYGGTWVDLETYAFHVQSWIGCGAEFEIETRALGLSDGAEIRASRLPERIFTLVGMVIGANLSDLHSKINQLLLAVTGQGRKAPEIWIRYRGRNQYNPLMIRARYRAGINHDEIDGFTAKLALQFIATNPVWVEDGESVVTISPSYLNTAGTSARVVRYQNGVFGLFSAGEIFQQDLLWACEIDANGAWYFGGIFLGIHRVLSIHDPSSVSQLATVGSGSVYALCFLASGKLLAGGSYTTIGGVTGANRLASFDGSTWTVIGPPNATVRAIVPSFDRTKAFIIGEFTDFGGSNGDGIVLYDDATQSLTSLGTGLQEGVGMCGALDPAGNLIVGGTFTSAGGVANTSYLALWDGSSWKSLGQLNGVVDAMVTDRRGNVYISGAFTQVTISGRTIQAYYVMMWDGSSLRQVGDTSVTPPSGPSGRVVSLAYDPVEDLVYASSSSYFYLSQGYTQDDRKLGGGVAAWNGTEWVRSDMGYIKSVGYSPSVKIFSHRDRPEETLFEVPNADAVPRTDILKSLPGASSDVRFRIYYVNGNGGGWIQLNGANLRFHKYLTSGETLLLDPRRGTLWSSKRGLLSGMIARSSQLSSMRLRFGDNYLVTHVPEGVVQMLYTPGYLSLD